ncbi:hypothetical protein [Pseudonocardia spinosispora]|uniref:hypothetical protein n=1 Tax=Pseudonocardia spinosispora TaxID=103441 RepID=UPI00146FBA3D|nr:hypothetical protein [Pseudonocardia spinosispora]
MRLLSGRGVRRGQPMVPAPRRPEPEAEPFDAVFAQIAAVCAPVAERFAGHPVRRIKPALRRAWRAAYSGELGEPVLGVLAQAIQDRQPSPIGWLSPPSLRRQSASAGAGVPNRFDATVELLPTGQAPGIAHNLVRDVMCGWGLSGRQVTEDAQLLTSSIVAAALDRADPRASLRAELTLTVSVLHVSLTVEHRAPSQGGVVPIGARSRRRSVIALLDTMADVWAQETYQGGSRTWFELTA